MFVVYEIFKVDEKKFFRFESTDKFECEVYINHHQYDAGALRKGDSKLIICEEK